jgi:glycosyltransferase involved in cell wall biosynthesis
VKISVLLPTRDRLDLLSDAVASVRAQADDDWEIVVSDNDSKQDIAGYVRSLGDERIRYLRTHRALPVNDNWNNALAAAEGEYVIMLGDDDALLPGYFATIRRLVGDFSKPDLIYHSALLYAYPSVLPDAPDGYLKPYGYAPFFKGAEHPFVLDPEVARAMVRGAMDFRVLYGFNMQFATVSRRMIAELGEDGPFYRSPFPDYYAMNLLFLRAREIVVEPRPCVVIGVSPKSYGFFYANSREREGRAMLGDAGEDAAATSPDEGLLPGSNINTGWLLAMDAVRRATGCPAEMSPNRRRYRMLQLAYVHQGFFLEDTISRSELDQMRVHMSLSERLGYGVGGRLLRTLDRALPSLFGRAIRDLLRRAQGQLPSWNPPNDPRRFKSILDVCRRYGHAGQRGHDATQTGTQTIGE